MTQRSIGRLCAITTMVCWSWAFILIRQALDAFTPASITFIRLSMATLIFSILQCLQGSCHRPSLSWQTRLKVLAMGALMFGGYNLSLNASERYIQPGIASFIICQIPVITTALAVLLLRESISKRQVLGLAISTLGVAALAYLTPGHPLHGFEGHTTQGIVLSMTAALIASLYTIFQKKTLNAITPMQLTYHALLGGCLVTAFAAPESYHAWLHADMSARMSVMALGIFPSALAFFCWAHALSRLPATQAAATLYAMPIITMSMAGWLMQEWPDLAPTACGLIALGGAWMVQKAQTTK